MVLIEDYPKDSLVSHYIDRYQFFIIENAAFLKTVPNGKIECYFVLEGEFLRWEDESGRFASSNKMGFLPASNKLSFFQIPNRLICLNIKLNLNVLSLSYFSNFLTNWSSFDVVDFIDLKTQKSILTKMTKQTSAIHTEAIDQVLSQWILSQTKDEVLEKLMLQVSAHREVKISDLAAEMNMSLKTFERLIKKHFNLTPKELLQVIRFENTTSHIKKNESQKLIEALGFGYYDQSHFIKECKKITGYPPKEFFSKLKLQTNDIIFES